VAPFLDLPASACRSSASVPKTRVRSEMQSARSRRGRPIASGGNARLPTALRKAKRAKLDALIGRGGGEGRGRSGARNPFPTLERGVIWGQAGTHSTLRELPNSSTSDFFFVCFCSSSRMIACLRSIFFMANLIFLKSLTLVWLEMSFAYNGNGKFRIKLLKYVGNFKIGRDGQFHSGF